MGCINGAGQYQPPPLEPAVIPMFNGPQKLILECVIVRGGHFKILKIDLLLQRNNILLSVRAKFVLQPRKLTSRVNLKSHIQLVSHKN